MRLIYATADFVYRGMSRPGFPLILDDDFSPLEPFQTFLYEELLDRGPFLKPTTWRAYGARLWDFVSFLRGQGIHWKSRKTPSGAGPVVDYRDWSRIRGQSVAVSTANDRLSLVLRFYEWALKTNRIVELPFHRREIQPSSEGPTYEHYPPRTKGHELLGLEFLAPLAFITKQQVALIRAAQLKPSAKLMFEMTARTGMRSSEVRTFPASRVFNPRDSPWLDPNGVIRVELNASEMELKFDRSRIIEVPYSLMQDMYTYKTCYRNGLVAEGQSEPALLLTARGRPFTKDAVVGTFAAISSTVGFRVRAHMMRHTFAIYFLLALRRLPDYQGSPLEHLMTQLGHTDIRSVMVYLKHIGIADNATNIAIQQQLDDIFAD